MLKVLKSGFYTTLQDEGRFGYRDKGVPVSGVMDLISTSHINRLLENDINAAVLEITMTGPTLLFQKNSYIALSGALMSPTLNNKPIQIHKIYKVRQGDILSYGKLEKGFRSYLAIKGGFNTSMVLNSKSNYYPITESSYLSDMQEIDFDEIKLFEPKISELKIETLLEVDSLEVSKGPEYDMLNKNQLSQLFTEKFKISKENNRMAYQLEQVIEGHSKTILTSATLPGTVQFTPAGKLIILMKDGQTTGGYPRILQLTEEAICVLAQKRTSDNINFRLV